MPTNITIDGALLRQDRDDLGFSRTYVQQKMLELGVRCSMNTLVRAEKDGSISRRYLEIFAHILSRNPTRYHLGGAQEDIPTIYDINGDWTALYLEQDLNTETYIAVERLNLTHNGNDIQGIYEPEYTDHPDGYLGDRSFILKGRYIGNSVFGDYLVDGQKFPTGTGTFHLKITRMGRCAEGFCTFYSDDELIILSKNIWIKNSDPTYQNSVKAAKEYLKSESLFLATPFLDVVT